MSEPLNVFSWRQGFIVNSVLFVSLLFLLFSLDVVHSTMYPFVPCGYGFETILVGLP